MAPRWGAIPHHQFFYKYGTPMGCYSTSLIFYKYDTSMGCYSTSSIFHNYSTPIGADCVRKIMLKPSSTGSSHRDEIFVNKTIISTPPYRGGMLNPDYALGIKELINLLTNLLDCHGLTLTILTAPSVFIKLRLTFSINFVRTRKQASAPISLHSHLR